EEVSRLAPASRILVLTASRKRDHLLGAIAAGACGYLLKDARPEEIVNGVRAAAAGECVLSPCIGQELLAYIRDRGVRVAAGDDWSADAIRAVLTERELEIFTRLASGESNQGIGRAFSLSESTVK